MQLKRYIAPMLAMLLCLMAGCGSGGELADPYAGMVQVANGHGGTMWIRPYDSVAVNDISASDFAGGKYTGDKYEAAYGIDVSEHQGEIDWQAAAADGIDFAVIRAGYRGYSKGGLFQDLFFDANMQGAHQAGIDIGIYFFSQAISVDEAVEEAEYLLDMLGEYRDMVSLPVFFDWEHIGQADARADGLDGDELTACAEAFCRTINQAGYEAGIYAYRSLGYFNYDLSKLTDFEWWIAALGDGPDFYYSHRFWQHSVTGSVAGIDGEVDMDVMFTPIVQPGEDAGGSGGDGE